MYVLRIGLLCLIHSLEASSDPGDWDPNGFSSCDCEFDDDGVSFFLHSCLDCVLDSHGGVGSLLTTSS